MTTRTDVTVDYSQSPRIIEIAAPSTEIVVQDIVDTIRIDEATFQGISNEKLLDASGKQSLGGGVLVGITGEFKDAQIAFEPRTNVAQAGAVTTGSGVPIKGRITFSDANADFGAASVVRGSLVVNYDDRSVADVFSVDSNTQLTTRTLKNGISNAFTIGDNYAVYNIVQVNLLGGNQVAVDDLEAEISPVLPTAFTQVVRTSSSSATLQELTAIQFSSFQNAVWVDAINGVTGTDFPAGTPESPVISIPQATSIAEARGFSSIRIKGDFTFDTGDIIEDYLIIGDGEDRSNFVVNAGAILANSEVKNTRLDGTLDGGTTLRNCHLGNLQFINGEMHSCALTGTITLGGNVEAGIVNCYSDVPGNSTPTVDMGGSGQALHVRNYVGGLTIANKNGFEEASLDFISGNFIIANTVTEGTVIVRGTSGFTNNGGSNVVVDTTKLIFPEQIQLSNFHDRVIINTIEGSAGTGFPIGTYGNQSNNLADAISIANFRGLSQLLVQGTLNVLPGDNITDFIITGENPGSATIILIPGCITNNTTFKSVTLTGTVNGTIICQESGVVNLSNVGSTTLGSAFTECQFLGPTPSITMNNTSNTILNILESYSGVKSKSGPIIDLNHSSGDITISGWKGGITLDNWTGGQTGDISLYSGYITANTTCNNGLMLAHGIATIDDNSTGTFLIDSNAIITSNTTAAAVWNYDLGGSSPSTAAEKMNVVHIILQNKSVTDPDTGIMTVYADDGVTPLLTAPVYEGKTTAQPYRGQGIERREKLD